MPHIKPKAISHAMHKRTNRSLRHCVFASHSRHTPRPLLDCHSVRQRHSPLRFGLR